MKRLLLLFFAVGLTACGWFGARKPAAGRSTAETYTVEDTVLRQIGGELYYPELSPTDSITVIEAHYYQPDSGALYREYHFIVHNRDTRTHSHLLPDSLDLSYARQKADGEYYYDPQFDSVRTESIDPALRKFDGYWLYLTKYQDNYYFDDYMEDLMSFRIADSTVTKVTMDGLWIRKIRLATVLPDGGFSIALDRESAVVFEPVDSLREIYRMGDDRYVIPARAIHNVEIIQSVNSTGDLISLSIPRVI